MNVFIGEVRLMPYNFAPVGWHDCDGSLLSIADNELLFAVLSTTYGGNGVTNFGVPDLRGRVPLNQGTGIGLTPRVLGQMSGSESVTLLPSQTPGHSHLWTATAALATTGVPALELELGAVTAAATAYATDVTGLTPAALGTNAMGMAGGNGPHDNMMPTMTLRYCIATTGIYPSPG